MKKAFLVFGLLVFSYFSIAAQNTSPALQEARNLNAEVVKLFQQRKYKEALPFAQKAVEIQEKELGKDDSELAKTLANLGFVQYLLDNKKEAQTAFEKSVEIFDSKDNLEKEDNLLVAGMLEKIALLKYAANNSQGAENSLKKSLTAYQKAGEQNSAKAANILFSLGNLNSANKNYESSAGFFTQVLEIRINKLGEENISNADVFERCACVLKKAGKERNIKPLQEKYFPAEELLENGTLNFVSLKSNSFFVRVDGKVVNGKALNLVKPSYPLEAKQARAEGAVSVRVNINEQGIVTFACGAFSKSHPALIEASEAAAYESKFSPTILNGKPVKVTGVVVYNFIR